MFEMRMRLSWLWHGIGQDFVSLSILNKTTQQCFMVNCMQLCWCFCCCCCCCRSTLKALLFLLLTLMAELLVPLLTVMAVWYLFFVFLVAYSHPPVSFPTKLVLLLMLLIFRISVILILIIFAFIPSSSAVVRCWVRSPLLLL